MLNNTRDKIFFVGKLSISSIIFTIIQLVTLNTIRIQEFSMGYAVDVARTVLCKTNPVFIARDIKPKTESFTLVDESIVDVSTIEILIKRTTV